LKHEARNASALRNQGVAYEQIARAYELRKEWVQARDWYRKSVALWDRVRADGLLIPAYVKKAEGASQSLSRLEKMTGSGPE